MARTDTLTNFLTDVAAAIKAKKGDNTAIPAANFDTEIANLPSGSGDNTALINLIDRSVKSIEIPEGTTSIGGSAFSHCTGLTSITIPDSVTNIGYQAFYDCRALTSITIPNSVTSIGYYAFYYCTSLTSMNVSSGNTVYHSAGNCLIETETKTLIYGCKNSIIPSDGSVTSIGGSAFSYCTGLTSITIPDSVTSIGDSAFSNCTGLTSVTIGNSVTSIGNSAFYGCTGLTEIDFSTHTTVPTLNSTTAFDNTFASLVIKVPSALVDEWKAATNWATYADKIVGV